MKLEKIGGFLLRSKIPVDIEDNKEYKRVTIRINHNGVSLRDKEVGKKIGTKKQFILKSGQFILSKIDARYGAFGIAPDEVEGAIITGNFWAYDVDKRKVNIEWFNQFTNSPDFYELCERASSGITHRKYLDETFFLNYEILLPNVDEQLVQIEKIKEQKISFGKLSTELIHQQDLVKQLRQAFLREAMQGKLVKQEKKDGNAKELLEKIKAEKAKSNKKEKPLPPIREEEIPFDIPENWVWCRLGEIAYIASGSTPKQDAFVSKGIPYLKMYNLKHQQIDFDYKPQYIKEEIHNGQLKRSRTQVGDVIMNIVGPPLGKLAIIPESLPEANFNQAGVLIRPYLVKELNKWIYYYLNEMSEINSISTKGVAGQDNISVTQSNYIKIPLPPLLEQNRIVKRLEEVMALCEELKTTITDNQNYTGQLLQVALKDALQSKEEITL